MNQGPGSSQTEETETARGHAGQGETLDSQYEVYPKPIELLWAWLLKKRDTT